MSRDDYEECLLHDCNAMITTMMMDNSIIELNIIENNNGINQNYLQDMLTKYRQKELITDNMKDHLKYSIELLVLFKTSNVSNDKIVDWFYSCDNIDALCVVPKRGTILKQ